MFSDIYRQIQENNAKRKGRNRDNAERPGDDKKLVTRMNDAFDQKAHVNQNHARNKVSAHNHNHRDQNKKPQAASDVIADVTKSNRTIFDPSDHVITYESLRGDKDFIRSLLDDSRNHDSYWGPDFPITPQGMSLIPYGHAKMHATQL